MFYITIEYTNGKVIEAHVSKEIWHLYLMQSLEADDGVAHYCVWEL